MKISDFGVQIPVCPLEFDFVKNTYVQQIAVQSAEHIDDAIVAEMYKIAMEAGVTNLIVLDKKNIREALMKASEQDVHIHTRTCPACNGAVVYRARYCHTCGQKLNWFLV